MNRGICSIETVRGFQKIHFIVYIEAIGGNAAGYRLSINKREGGCLLYNRRLLF